MFCKNCGNKIEKDLKFCTKCGNSVVYNEKENFKINQKIIILNDKWWHRLLKVIYIITYIPLLLIVPLVWSENLPYCYTYTYSVPSCSGSYSESFWYSLLTLVIYVVIIRLIKIAVLYVVVGQKPEWKNEFKKFF